MSANVAASCRGENSSSHSSLKASPFVPTILKEARIYYVRRYLGKNYVFIEPDKTRISKQTTCFADIARFILMCRGSAEYICQVKCTYDISYIIFTCFAIAFTSVGKRHVLKTDDRTHNAPEVLEQSPLFLGQDILSLDPRQRLLVVFQQSAEIVTTWTSIFEGKITQDTHSLR